MKTNDYQKALLKDLQDPVEAREYLNAALEENDPALFLLALRNVAEARGGMQKVAAMAHLNRENLYRMLSQKGNPEFYSLKSLIQALGLKLAIQS